jgi:hypothetical protein
MYCTWRALGALMGLGRSCRGHATYPQQLISKETEIEIILQRLRASSDPQSLVTPDGVAAWVFRMHASKDAESPTPKRASSGLPLALCSMFSRPNPPPPLPPSRALRPFIPRYFVRCRARNPVHSPWSLVVVVMRILDEDHHGKRSGESLSNGASHARETNPRQYSLAKKKKITS